METRIIIEYKKSEDTNTFGTYSLSFKDSNSAIHKVDLKFDFKQLWSFSRDTTSVAFDFLILALIIYSADRILKRSLYSDTGWRRDIVLENIPVINLNAMQNGADYLCRAISFLTGDNWNLNFVKADEYNYSPSKKISSYNASEYEFVSLFSGGLDSLIGFIDKANDLNENKKILLISHMELGKEHGDQSSILDYCNRHNIYDGKYDQLLLNAGLKQKSWNICTPTESTFRSRSLLFFAAGIYVAYRIGPTIPLIVPENGTISINIPLDAGRRSSCSTRTTHPTFIRRIQQALSVIGIHNTLINPYRFKSKADMMSDCAQNPQKLSILKSLYDLSCSCAKRGHNVFWDKSGFEIRDAKIKHCGMCLPCLYRRVALDAIGLDDENRLGTDVLNGIKYSINNPIQKRNRDFNALLYFIKNRMNERTIRRELFLNGISDNQELKDYTSLALHSYEQIVNWLMKKANQDILKKAGL
ncbi:MAG: hypothetical protein PHX50_10280 [Massilibacteroides sp.]|nr:hypothetical protein [Massilibacteroides sp.]